MSRIRLADDLALPLDFVTQASAILARRGAGKTYTASVLVEEVVKARQPVVVLDPTGAWWGLRSSADGAHEGLPVVILGGEHGDIPLEPTAGKEIANVVLEHPGAYVIDFSALESRRAEIRFSTDFLERLYRAKKRESGPLLLVVDEADTFAPQRPVPAAPNEPSQARTLGALEAIVRRGRIKGLGAMLITQRSAVLNKNVLSQIEVLIVMQTTGPQDRAAIDEWIKGNGTPEERDAVLGSLASLERGEAWVWSPAWLRILQRVRVRRRETFDSSATPEAGQQAIEPRAFAPVDLEQLGERIRSTIEKAKEADPAELRKRIRALESQLASVPRETSVETVVETVIERVEVPVLNGQVEHLEQIVAQMQDIGAGLVLVGTGISGAAQSITDAIARVQAGPPSEGAGAGRAPRVVGPSRQRPQPATDGGDGQNVASARPIQPPAPQETGGAPLGKAARSFLAALAQFPAGRTKSQAAFLAGYSPSVSTTKNTLGWLRARALISGSNDLLRITDAGLEVLGDWEPAPTGAALVEWWYGRLGKAEQAFLRAAVEAYPRALTKGEAAAVAGYDPGVSTTKNTLGRLRSLGLLEGDNEAILASPDLVEGT